MTDAPVFCPTCERSNPPDARFCNRCGAQLDLVHCPHCGAVNQITALRCNQCDGELAPGAAQDQLPLPPPATTQPVAAQRYDLIETMPDATPAFASPRRHRWTGTPRMRTALLAAAAVAILAAIGFALLPGGPETAEERPSSPVSSGAIRMKPEQPPASATAPAPAKSAGAASDARKPCSAAMVALGLCERPPPPARGAGANDASSSP